MIRVSGSALAYLLSFTLIGCTSTVPDSPQDLFNRPPLDAIPALSQFDRDDALALLEFCVNLDSQDDLHPHLSHKNKEAG